MMGYRLIRRESSTMSVLAAPPRTGAAVLFDVLRDLGVEVIFGHTGGAVIPLHVELNKRMRRGEPVPRFVMCRQEGGAGHAAEGYARACGRVGVALATSGPGATNLVTPIADAYKDSVPTVFISGQVASSAIGSDAFQEVDTVGITRPISKHNYLVKDVADLEWSLREAFALAAGGRPGPVVVDICKDAQLALLGQSNRPRPRHREPVPSIAQWPMPSSLRLLLPNARSSRPAAASSMPVPRRCCVGWRSAWTCR
jgi:acetolactate synthase-1/2/3 large subunit